MSNALSFPVDMPRRADQSAVEHEQLMARTRQVDRYDDTTVASVRQDARQNLMTILGRQELDMDREERATFAAISRFIADTNHSKRNQIQSTFDGADSSLARMGRRFALGEISDDLDAARLVMGHRGAMQQKPSSKKKTQHDDLSQDN